MIDNRALTALVLILAEMLRVKDIEVEGDPNHDFVPDAVRLIAEREREVLNLFADARHQQ